MGRSAKNGARKNKLNAWKRLRKVLSLMEATYNRQMKTMVSREVEVTIRTSADALNLGFIALRDRPNNERRPHKIINCLLKSCYILQSDKCSPLRSCHVKNHATFRCVMRQTQRRPLQCWHGQCHLSVQNTFTVTCTELKKNNLAEWWKINDNSLDKSRI